MKLNDVRVLRNILGDKYEDEGPMALKRYEPKKLVNIALPNMPAAFGLKKDEWSWDAKLGKLPKVKLLRGTGKLEQYQSESKDAKPVDIPQKEDKQPSFKMLRSTVQKGIESSPENIERFKKLYARDIERDLQRKEKGLRQQAAEDALTALEEQKKFTERQRSALGIKTRDEREAELFEQQIALTKQQRGMLEEQRYGSLAEEKAAQAGLALQLESSKTAVQEQRNREQIGQLRFEQTRFGQFLKGPYIKTAERVTENIGENLGGSIVGPFTAPGASKNVKDAITTRNAYIQLVKRRYETKKPPIKLSGPADIMAYGTAGERKRLAELNRGVERSQAVAASGGFMGGASGQFILGRTRHGTSSANLSPLTRLGTGGGGTGSFSPEAFSRLGVTQNLSAIRPESKWDTLLSRGGGGSMDRIAQMLGKTPNPVGARVKKVLTPIGAPASEDAREKLKRFL